MDVSFPLVPIGDLLKLRRESVPRESFADYLPITIHFDGSIDRRVREEPYKGPMFSAYPGDVVFSKIDLRNGAIAIVPAAFPKVVVTSEYPVHIPDLKQVDPRYFALLLRSPNLLLRLKIAASGTSGRKRIDSEKFGEVEIPLPDLLEQTVLIDEYEKKLLAAEAFESRADNVETKSIREFEAALGLIPPVGIPHKLLQIARYRNLDRWGHEAILQQAIRLRTLAHASTWESDPVSLRDYIEVMHGCSEGPSENPTKLSVLKISACTRGYFRPTEKKFMVDSPELRKKYDLRKGDVLMCRVNGTLAYVGMSALIEQDVSDCIFPDKIIRVRITNDALLPEFLWRVLQLPAMRNQIESVSRTAVGNHAIGSDDINELQLAIPPIEEQLKLTKSLQMSRLEASSLREKARDIRAVGLDNLLNAVFN